MIKHPKFSNILHRNRTMICAWVLAISILLPLGADAQDHPSAPDQQEISNREDLTGLRDQRLEKMTYIYKGEMTPAAYIQSHPAAIGTWQYKSETKTHWIGDLHYPTDNTDRAQSGPAYMAGDLKIKKVADLKIEMKKRNGLVLLEKADPKSALDSRDGKVSDFTLIGYEQQGERSSGIVPLASLLPYMPSEAAKRTAELERFRLHFQKVEEVIRMRTVTKDNKDNPVLESFKQLCVDSIQAGEEAMDKSQEQETFYAAQKLLYKKVQQDLDPILERARRQEKYTQEDHAATMEIDATIRAAIQEFSSKELAELEKE